ncbi:MAG: alanine racemase, partial [Microbacteriaceae bacterium]|nr:alanine racemase [Microbacteriaceae bacterium]
HRNGALAKDWPELVAAAATAQSAGDISVVGIWSHLADTSLAEDLVALEKFHHAVEVATSASLTPELLHIAASAAASDLPQARLDLVRVGIIAYGISPFDDRSAKDLGFAPVMTLRAPIISVDEKCHTARVGIGYGDGVLPLPPNTGWVAWKGTRLDIREVAVDHLVIEIDPTTIPTTGDMVTLWGDPDAGSPLAEDWASWAGTIGDEVVAAVGAHIQRRFID